METILKAGAKQGKAAPVEGAPMKGLMYAQLGFDSSDRNVSFRFSQKVALQKNTSLKFFGQFKDAKDPQYRVQVTHKDFVPSLNARINCRLRYDLQKKFVKSGMYLKKRWPINDSTSVNMKMEVVGRLRDSSEKTSCSKEPEFAGKIEVSKTLLNVTTTQDCRIRVGVDLGSKLLYLQLRENHLMLTADSKGEFKFLYDF